MNHAISEGCECPLVLDVYVGTKYFVNYFNSLKKRDKKSSLLILALTGCCTGQVNYK